MSKINVGDKAPDFTLLSFSHTDQPVEYTLSNFAGKDNVLLVFFPMAFTGVCTEQNCTISDSLNDFASSGVKVFGISTDGTFVQKEFAKSSKIQYPLLSDYNKEVIHKFDVVQETFAHGMKNTSRRGVFLIGKDGLVKYKEITENPGVQVNFDKLKEAVKNLG
jgi:peroxiredoxin